MADRNHRGDGPHLIMFDIDGTLVDSDDFDGGLYAEAMREVLGVDVDETWQSYANVTDSGILEALVAAAGGEAAALATRAKSRFVELVARHLECSPSAAAPIPGAAELVLALRARPDVTVAIATGGWRETAELKLRVAGIDHEGFAFASSSDAVARTDIMRIAERRAGPRFARRTYFGDGPWDRRASLALGWDFIGVGSAAGHTVAFGDLSDRDAIFAALGLAVGA